MPGLRRARRLADREGPVDVLGVRPTDISDREDESFHRIRTPLSTWFAAIWFITSQKNGVSAQGLQRVLGFGSYETAWAWMHKLRRAMVRPERELLSGVVELDEVFIGNESRGRAGGVKDTCAAMIAVESMPRDASSAEFGSK